LSDGRDHGISAIIVDCAVKVHKTLGPGLLESIYKSCLIEELVGRGLDVRTEVPMPVVYNGRKLEAGYRLDILVNNLVIVELKAVEAISPVHEAQVLTYLKLSDKRLALLLNFHVALMKDGIRRYIV
jgi:GxxExxY protein